MKLEVILLKKIVRIYIFFGKKGHAVLKYDIKREAISSATFFIGKDKIVVLKYIEGNKYEYINANDDSNEINLHKSFKTIFRNLFKEMF